jgi:hypothetical protein
MGVSKTGEDLLRAGVTSDFDGPELVSEQSTRAAALSGAFDWRCDRTFAARRHSSLLRAHGSHSTHATNRVNESLPPRARSESRALRWCCRRIAPVWRGCRFSRILRFFWERGAKAALSDRRRTTGVAEATNTAQSARMRALGTAHKKTPPKRGRSITQRLGAVDSLFIAAASRPGRQVRRLSGRFGRSRRWARAWPSVRPTAGLPRMGQCPAG